MKGKYHIIIQNNRVHYEFDLKRNITVIRGNSATGKTTLIGLIDRAARLGKSSGVMVSCGKKCRTLNDSDWQLILQNTHENIIFIDEDSQFIKSREFAAAIKASDNYFVIISREELPHLPYSVEEIYGIHTSGRYHDLKLTYNELYRIYDPNTLRPGDLPINPEKVVVEDSNSGYQFFNAVCSEKGIDCISAGGKSNIRRQLEYALFDKDAAYSTVLVIADGAAIGPEMNKLYQFMKLYGNVKLYLPESFEWLILKSGLVDGITIQNILQNPEEYIDSQLYMSWEQFFTDLLIEYTKDSYLKYGKSRLNKVYLHENEKKAILGSIEGIKFVPSIILKGV